MDILKRQRSQAREITARQTVCPGCSKPDGTGKFCNSCDVPLGLMACPKCRVKNPTSMSFCGECGNRLK